MFENTKGKIDRSKNAASVYAGRINLKRESEAVKWIKTIGLWYKKATQKEFPNFVFKLNKEQLSLLLGKMFQGDGCINFKRKYPQIFYATSSLKMAQQFQHLLLRLNIITSLHYKKFKYRGGIKNGYTLTINRYKNIKNLYQYLGPYLIGKQKKCLEKIIKTHPIISGKIKENSARGSKDTIPAEILEMIRKEIKKQGFNSYKAFAKEIGVSDRLICIDKRKKGYLRETLNIIGKALKSKDILNYANSDVYWDEIIKIEPVGKEQTYDITINGTHNFLANDFIVHNSHASCYATIAYQTAYLKAHYPIEFMAALLTSEKNDVERIAVLIEECKRMGIEVLAPDINESFRNFSVVPDDKQIRFGLLAIKNVGQNIVGAIVEERKNQGPFQSMNDFVERVQSKDLNKKSLEALIKAGTFDNFGERGQLLFNLEKLLEINRETQKTKNNGQKGLFEGMEIKNCISLEICSPATKKEKLTWEKELLGLYVSSHPLEDFKEVFRKKTASILKVRGEGSVQTASSPWQKKRVKIGGVISNIKKIITKTGKPMLFINVEDLTAKIEVIIFPGLIERNPAVFQENKIVFISGRLDNKDGVPKVICEEVEEIIEKV